MSLRKNLPLQTVLSASPAAPQAPSTRSQIRGMFARYGVPLTYYTSGETANPDERLSRIEQELGSGQRSWSNLENSLRTAAGQLSPTLREAETQAGIEFDPVLNQIQRNMGSVRNQTDRDIDIQQRYGQYGQEATANTYGALSNMVNQNNQATQTAYQGARQGVSQAYGQASGEAEVAMQRALAAIQGDAERLGLPTSAADPSAELRTIVAGIQGRNAQNSANATSNIDTLTSALGGIGRQAVTDVGLESADNQSRLQTEVMRAIAETQLSGAEGQNELLAQLGDLTSQRSGRVSQLQREFDERDYERGRQSELDRLAGEIQRGTLDLQRQELGLNRDRFGLDAQLGLGQLELQRQQLQADMARQAPGSLESRRIEAEIREIDAAIAQSGSQLTGRSGVDTYLREQLPRNSMGAPVVDPAQVSPIVDRVIQQGMSGAGRGENPVSAAMDWLGRQREREDGLIDLPALTPIIRRALDIYFGLY